MRHRIITTLGLLAALVVNTTAAAPLLATPAKDAVEFGHVVKLIERHYGVKHKSVPFMAKMGIKAGEFAARRLTRYSEYGNVKFAIFEDQDFTAARSGRSSGSAFAETMRASLQPEWMPLVEVRMQQDSEQTLVYTRGVKDLFKVLVVQIGQRDGLAVQVDIKPERLLMLMRDPEAMGKTLADEATEEDSPE